MDVCCQGGWTSLRKVFYGQNITIINQFVLNYMIKTTHAQTSSMHSAATCNLLYAVMGNLPKPACMQKRVKIRYSLFRDSNRLKCRLERKKIDKILKRERRHILLRNMDSCCNSFNLPPDSAYRRVI